MAYRAGGDSLDEMKGAARDRLTAGGAAGQEVAFRGWGIMSERPGQKLDYVFDAMSLDALADKLREGYVSARPFPHVVIDNFLPQDTLRAVLSEFPAPGQIDWINFSNYTEKKLATQAETQIGPRTRFLLYQFNSSVFIKFLERLTAIEGLLPDPHFWGGGLHQIERGGFLKIHADFTRHPVLPLDRRLNVLLYLNEDWREAYGGHLELWDKDLTECVVRVLPVFNRCVIFNTAARSYHGHPDPVTCPPGMTRKSLALYYFSNGRPEEEDHVEHGTMFVPRPNESFKVRVGGALTRPQRVKGLIKRLLPPILIDLKSYLKPKR
jgi:hypothetical protein